MADIKRSDRNYPGKGDTIGDNQGIQPTGSPPASTTLGHEASGKASLEKIITVGKKTSDGLGSMPTRQTPQDEQGDAPAFSFDFASNNKANGAGKPRATGS